MCFQRFISYLNDRDAEVLEAASRILRTQGLLAIPEAPEVLRHYAKSAAFLNNPSVFFFSLSDQEGSMLPLGEAIIAAVDSFLVILSAPAGPQTRRSWGDGLDCAKLLLRLYNQGEGDNDLRGQCLDRWDALLKSGDPYRRLLAQLDAA